MADMCQVKIVNLTWDYDHLLKQHGKDNADAILADLPGELVVSIDLSGDGGSNGDFSDDMYDAVLRVVHIDPVGFEVEFLEPVRWSTDENRYVRCDFFVNDGQNRERRRFLL